MKPLRILNNMRTIILICILLFSVLSGTAHANQSDDEMELETSVCGLKEPFLFWIWSGMAGRADASRLKGLEGVEDIAFSSQDSRVLRGYKLHSRVQPAQGYLLVLQGNAILADQLIGEFTSYASAGYDVYMYDYRGYGRSEGKRRLKAMVSDTREIVAALNGLPYPRRLVYAFSFGGILLLDSFEAEFDLNRVVIDSSPGRLSNYGCPVQFDPVEHLPDDCSPFLFISGQRDTVVTPSMTEELLREAKQRKARIVDDVDFTHPFMESIPTLHQQRMEMIEGFLLSL